MEITTLYIFHYLIYILSFTAVSLSLPLTALSSFSSTHTYIHHYIDSFFSPPTWKFGSYFNHASATRARWYMLGVLTVWASPWTPAVLVDVCPAERHANRPGWRWVQTAQQTESFSFPGWFRAKMIRANITTNLQPKTDGEVFFFFFPSW